MTTAPAISRAAIETLCRKHGVRALWLFGSATRADFSHTDSDVDFLVEFQPMTPVAHKNAYFGLWEALESLMQRRVDLVEPGGVRNTFVLARIEAEKVPLYAAA